jgi:hypothetical protein
MLAGAANVGKSSVLNLLAGRDGTQLFSTAYEFGAPVDRVDLAQEVVEVGEAPVDLALGDQEGDEPLADVADGREPEGDDAWTARRELRARRRGVLPFDTLDDGMSGASRRSQGTRGGGAADDLRLADVEGLGQALGEDDHRLRA